MKCSSCKWYKPFGAESTDQCLHEKAESHFGGVRTESVVIHRSCNVMLKTWCEDHKLYEVAI